MYGFVGGLLLPFRKWHQNLSLLAQCYASQVQAVVLIGFMGVSTPTSTQGVVQTDPNALPDPEGDGAAQSGPGVRSTETLISAGSVQFILLCVILCSLSLSIVAYHAYGWLCTSRYKEVCLMIVFYLRLSWLVPSLSYAFCLFCLFVGGVRLVSRR